MRARLGMKTIAIDYVKVTPADRIPAIVERRADLECGSTTDEAERRQKDLWMYPTDWVPG